MTEAEGQPLAQPRRRDRAVDDDGWVRDFLARAAHGTLATARDGQPFVNMNLFVYDSDKHAIFLHTARTGRTRANVEAEERVCFCVSSMGRLLPSKVALEFSVEYEGVTVFGRAAVVTDEVEARGALQRLLDKYFPHLRPGRDYRPITPEELARTTVYRIAIDEWGGKRKAVAADFPGAFRFGDAPPAASSLLSSEAGEEGRR
jgi:nitroimidazol reductase NimA-like FMN-containing flavoprotein (pyridoxamine 5'-phosphate oxidase superfamily)